ncbi:hypothetical protein [Rubrivirga sp. IMCC43871]|uniref:hypothetical protein n=1 Tax=Rubrivirga sp. IMCC43871 TaxID=3391575 RepID=UPI003990368A
MADDSAPRPDLSKGVLDLSTGPAAPPPPAPTPRPPAVPDPAVRVGQALDLSTGRPPSGPPRKPSLGSLGSGPLIRETVDFSSLKPPAPAEAPAKAERAPRAERRAGHAPRQRDDRNDGGHSGNRDRGKGTAPASSGSSLADLLDPEMLAKLRGG